MLGAAIVIWLAVVGIAVYAIHIEPGKHDAKVSKRLIVLGGAVAPAILLTGLLVYGLSLMPVLRAPPPEGSLMVEVAGEQWWWRVSYAGPGGARVELANEIRLPVGEPVEIRLSSPDVIHSFWVPSLGGKMDMIPGRSTWLVLEPSRTGTFRGVCAEYCGASHALMAFDVVVMERPEFDGWLEAQRRPAAEPVEPTAALGASLFLETGCGACHSVRGTEADGVVGPDLTHVGSRLSLAAATLDSDVGSFEDWLTHPEALKPGAHMPAFGMLPEEELGAMAAYLESLQ